MLEVCKAPEIEAIYAKDFIKEKISQKPELIKNNDFIDKLYAKIKSDPKPRKTIRSI